MTRFDWIAQRTRASLTALPALVAVLIVADYGGVRFVCVILAALLLLSILLARRSEPFAQVNWIDGAILLVAGFEVPSLLLSRYRPNGWDGALGLLFATVVYFVLRESLRSRVQLVAASSFSAASFATDAPLCSRSHPFRVVAEGAPLARPSQSPPRRSVLSA
jgi:hypothetical protein